MSKIISSAFIPSPGKEEYGVVAVRLPALFREEFIASEIFGRINPTATFYARGMKSYEKYT